MALRFYSVLVKPGAPPESARFVRDGFHLWAFVFTVLWALCRGLWFAALLIAAAIAAIVLLEQALGWPLAAAIAAQLVLGVLVGLEAGAWQRATLERRGWVEAAVVAAPSLDAAEQRYFGEIAHPLRP
jgi:hypothetical protein